MTTQAVSACVHGSRSQKYTATATDDVWNEVVDANSLSLYKTMKGQRITGYSGSYTGGCGILRIYNTESNQEHILGALDIITEEGYHPITQPHVVQQDDILQVLCVAVPT